MAENRQVEEMATNIFPVIHVPHLQQSPTKSQHNSNTIHAPILIHTAQIHACDEDTRQSQDDTDRQNHRTLLQGNLCNFIGIRWNLYYLLTCCKYLYNGILHITGSFGFYPVVRDASLILPASPSTQHDNQATLNDQGRHNNECRPQQSLDVDHGHVSDDGDVSAIDSGNCTCFLYQLILFPLMTEG